MAVLARWRSRCDHCAGDHRKPHWWVEGSAFGGHNDDIHANKHCYDDALDNPDNPDNSLVHCGAAVHSKAHLLNPDFSRPTDYTCADHDNAAHSRTPDDRNSRG